MKGRLWENATWKCMLKILDSDLWCWVMIAGLPAGFTTKEIDSEEDGELGEIQEGVNDFKVPGYRGPNPPAGVHSYSIKLYALDTKLKVGRKVNVSNSIVHTLTSPTTTCLIEYAI
jgi:phosphatidylethanolamine-binding protein (PEBP) family uncharacterized protein